MKWFKHVTDASDDEFLALMEEELGLESYARWWKMLEAIGKQMKPGSTQAIASYPISKWMTFLSAKQLKVLQTFVNFCQKHNKLTAIFSENILQIEVPKLLEMRDEYSRKSGQAPAANPDKLLPHKKSKSKEEEKESPPPPAGGDLLGQVQKPKFTLPEWVPAQTWADFADMRNKIRKPMTDRAKVLSINELDKLRKLGHDPKLVLEQSIKNSWQGLFQLREQPLSPNATWKDQPQNRMPSPAGG